MKVIDRHFTPEKWEQLRTHPYFEDIRAELTQAVENYLNTEPPRIRFSDIHLFVETGNRYIFERKAEDYTNRMLAYFLSYMIFGDDKYLEPLADVIWNICSFESWTIPAHISESKSLEERRCSMDLVSTRIGAVMSEVIYHIGDKLPELVVRRARAEVRERMIETFDKTADNDIYWFHRNTNWSAVCIDNILSCFLHLGTEEEIERNIPRMVHSAECYLSGLDDEGCCIEGYGYWGYGFGHFCAFADKLRSYTEGKIDMFKLDKVHQSALYQQHIMLSARYGLCFADANLGNTPAASFSHFLKNEYEDIEIPPLKPSFHVASLTRAYLWCDPELAECEFKPKSFIFKNAQWFVHHNEKYSFGAKAGHNNEIHNHNDVGSFIFLKDGELSFLDPGAGEYDAGYFAPVTRYKLFACSSRGHSVPVINGTYQLNNNKKSTVYEEAEDRYTFSMENVYDVEELTSLKRSFLCEKDGVVITDTYEFNSAPESIEERFVALTPISLLEGRAFTANAVLEFDPSLYDAEIQSEVYSGPGGRKQTGYALNLRVKNPTSCMELKFKIS